MREDKRFEALTEKEKQTLRLIVRGHDAKSIARNLGLSVHTINERLRDARRKMAVSSSREAARMLLEAEGPGLMTPETLGDKEIGDDKAGAPADQEGAPIGGAWRRPRLSWIIGGFVMTLALGLLALAALPQMASPPPAAAETSESKPVPEIVDTARQWLVLGDQKRWAESYAMTGRQFRKRNSAQRWTTVSEQVRVPMGAVVSRTFLSQQTLPAPPDGYEVVKFRTSFANRPHVTETVTLEREKGRWVVAGALIE